MALIVTTMLTTVTVVIPPVVLTQAMAHRCAWKPVSCVSRTSQLDSIDHHDACPSFLDTGSWAVPCTQLHQMPNKFYCEFFLFFNPYRSIYEWIHTTIQKTPQWESASVGFSGPPSCNWIWTGACLVWPLFLFLVAQLTGRIHLILNCSRLKNVESLSGKVLIAEFGIIPNLFPLN